MTTAIFPLSDIFWQKNSILNPNIYKAHHFHAAYPTYRRVFEVILVLFELFKFDLSISSRVSKFSLLESFRFS
jgi:hypothetical protein